MTESIPMKSKHSFIKGLHCVMYKSSSERYVDYLYKQSPVYLLCFGLFF